MDRTYTWWKKSSRERWARFFASECVRGMGFFVSGCEVMNKYFPDEMEKRQESLDEIHRDYSVLIGRARKVQLLVESGKPIDFDTLKLDLLDYAADIRHKQCELFETIELSSAEI